MYRVLLTTFLIVLVSCSKDTGMNYDLSKITCSEEWYEVSGWTSESKDFAKLKELAEVRSRLFQESLEGLSPSERESIEKGEDPFSNAEKFEEAFSYSKEFVAQLNEIEYVKDVTIDYYHGDSLVLTAHLNKPIDWRVYREKIPEVWRGVPVFVLQPINNT